MLEILTMLSAALLGGFILNFTPCVLPVVGLKVNSLLSAAHKGGVTKKSLLFCGGLVGTFIIMAFLVVAIKAAGGLAFWGFQFQSPWFCWAMALIFGVLSLSMMGVFAPLKGMGKKAAEGIYRLSGRFQQIGEYLSKKLPLLKELFQGSVTAVVGSACSGPLLAPALGAAFLLSWPYTVSVFTLIGVGMGAPYLLLCAFPKLLNLVPKPGKWMDWVRRASGFVLLLTAAWFVYLAI